MKHKYIESLLSEIQLLESKVENLKKSNRVPFSFFQESFKLIQEISRLLHELEFVQIEEMKQQMRKLVVYLSDSENSKKDVIVETIVAVDEIDKQEVSSEEEEQILPQADVEIDKAEQKEKKEVVEQEQQKPDTSLKIEEKDELASLHNATVEEEQEISLPPSTFINNHTETVLANIAPKNKSVNDVQPVNQTIQDVKRSISLNDRFLFQRELFDNNRDAMNTMLSKLQSFSSFNLAQSYLERNTTWDFKNETVDKFLQMLKDGFK